jgi:hypothetical protein
MLASRSQIRTERGFQQHSVFCTGALGVSMRLTDPTPGRWLRAAAASRVASVRNRRGAPASLRTKTAPPVKRRFESSLARRLGTVRGCAGGIENAAPRLLLRARFPRRAATLRTRSRRPARERTCGHAVSARLPCTCTGLRRRRSCSSASAFAAHPPGASAVAARASVASKVALARNRCRAQASPPMKARSGSPSTSRAKWTVGSLRDPSCSRARASSP